MTYSESLQTRPHLTPDVAISYDESLKSLFSLASGPVELDLQLVESHMIQTLTSQVDGVPEMMAYLVRSGGKRVRPLLTCLLARACGYEGTNHIAVASVAELLHTATLYHDDVVDEASLRRGRPTANHLFGNKVIVLAGDLMLAHCFNLLMEGHYFTISQRLSRTVCQMVEGEILQLQCEGNMDTAISQYMEIIANKTASLFAWCAESAAFLAEDKKTVSPDLLRALHLFGHHLGMAFQLTDDLMDFTGEQSVMGKSPLNDFTNAKITLPLLLVLKNHPHMKMELRSAFIDSNGSNQNLIASLREKIYQPGILKENICYIDQSLQQARCALELLPDSIYRQSLYALLEYLKKRNR